jgi:hypothetical protein
MRRVRDGQRLGDEPNKIAEQTFEESSRNENLRDLLQNMTIEEKIANGLPLSSKEHDQQMQIEGEVPHQDQEPVSDIKWDDDHTFSQACSKHSQEGVANAGCGNASTNADTADYERSEDWLDAGQQTEENSESPQRQSDRPASSSATVFAKDIALDPALYVHSCHQLPLTSSIDVPLPSKEMCAAAAVDDVCLTGDTAAKLGLVGPASQWIDRVFTRTDAADAAFTHLMLDTAQQLVLISSVTPQLASHNTPQKRRPVLSREDMAAIEDALQLKHWADDRLDHLHSYMRQFLSHDGARSADQEVWVQKPECLLITYDAALERSLRSESQPDLQLRAALFVEELMFDGREISAGNTTPAYLARLLQQIETGEPAPPQAGKAFGNYCEVVDPESPLPHAPQYAYAGRLLNWSLCRNTPRYIDTWALVHLRFQPDKLAKQTKDRLKVLAGHVSEHYAALWSALQTIHHSDANARQQGTPGHSIVMADQGCTRVQNAAWLLIKYADALELAYESVSRMGTW